MVLVAHAPLIPVIAMGLALDVSKMAPINNSMLYLREKVSTNPAITQNNWKAEHERGWRWVLNLRYFYQKESLEILEEYLLGYGKDAVTIGWPFSEEQMKPWVTHGYCGLYVRDIEGQIEELRRDLSDNDLLATWLHG